MAMFGLAVKEVLRRSHAENGSGGIQTRAIDKDSGNPGHKNVLETGVMTRGSSHHQLSHIILIKTLNIWSLPEENFYIIFPSYLFLFNFLPQYVGISRGSKLLSVQMNRYSKEHGVEYAYY